jgi:hypothetical protein
VQLVKSQAFFENESAFLMYLHMAILVSSVAIALMGFSAWARVNPLRHPEVQVVSTQVRGTRGTGRCALCVRCVFVFKGRA